ncbi:o-succinylbenzoate--CoA ligase [Halobacterium sp. R2-5]|uniref:o-succinylbenzoate--CoA ligase n=1 Tax=Halobacterium sp. R2-5 TaxID=2715751 RepID=UPI0014249A2D|nr:o-succinylbenzoate--CoA ligase [Halobacterium sp. R2-5]NIB99465.1 o-succinylbenzoate--CoA ligase [Halobacterium sp. R2-5]
MRDAVALQARSNPGGTALVDAATGSSWTFRELDADVEETAGRLAACGVRGGDRVAVLMENRPAFVRLVFACARLGAVLVPLNARLAGPELRAQAERVGPALVVCESDTEDAARALPVPAVSVDASSDVERFAAHSPEAVEPADLSWTDTRAVMFTSGTTGDPKAVRLTYANFAASAVASAFRLGVLPGDRWLCPLSLYHMGGLSVVLRSALYGTTAVLARGFDADETRAALADYDCTGVSLVPTMLTRLLDAGGLPDSLRFALVGGAPTPPELVERALDAGVPVCPTFGMTETTSQVATLHATEAADRPDSVGRPLLGTDVTVLGDDGEVLSRGETGELVVSGPTVTPGYLSADANGERFCEHGLRTGDFGFVDADGFLHVGGRQTDQIVTGGENVHPEEVTDALRDHPGVADAAVVGLPDEEWGERVAALVVRESDGVTAEDLRAFCEDRLAGYKHPRTVAFADELPRTASGTVDREAVRDELAGEN